MNNIIKKELKKQKKLLTLYAGGQKEFLETLKDSDTFHNEASTLGAIEVLKKVSKKIETNLEDEANEIKLLLQASISNPFLSVSFWYDKELKQYGAVLFELDDTIIETRVHTPNKATALKSIKEDIHNYNNSNAEVALHAIYVRGYDDILPNKQQEEIAYKLSQMIENDVIVIDNIEYDWSISK